MALADPAFCERCGTRLVVREQPQDGPEPWCPRCREWRYPGFNVACSMVVRHPDGGRVLLIDQYGRHGVLVAGYVARGESLEACARREVAEETGLSLSSVSFNASQFFAPSNTLMVNFVCQAQGAAASPQPGEVDAVRWVDEESVLDEMPDGSLARWFVGRALGAWAGPWQAPGGRGA